MNSKRYIAIFVSLIVFLFINTSITFARSVYVISDTEDSKMQAYIIEGTSLTYQKDYICGLDPSGGAGAVGLAIDDSEYGDFLFVTFEDEDEIELVNAKTMISEENPVLVPNASYLAGISIYEDGKYLNTTGDFNIMIYISEP